MSRAAYKARARDCRKAVVLAGQDIGAIPPDPENGMGSHTIWDDI